MMDLSAMSLLIVPVFLGVAFAYASVGLGGGSSYTALMVLFGFSYVAIPTLSLSLNLLVAFMGCFNFVRHKHARMDLILPFLASSAPMAYVGGMLSIPKLFFYWLLWVSLIFVAIRIYFWKKTSFELSLGKKQKLLLSFVSGALLGFIAGVVGIGGGIYLVPLIIMLGMGTVKEAAACGAVIVCMNSVTGLIARLQYQPIDMKEYLPLVVAVLLGGVLGSYLGSSKFKPIIMEKILGGVVLVAILFMGKKLLLT